MAARSRTATSARSTGSCFRSRSRTDPPSTSATRSPAGTPMRRATTSRRTRISPSGRERPGSSMPARLRAPSRRPTSTLRRALYEACTDPAGDAAWEAVATEARAAVRHSTLSRDEPPGRRWSVAPAAGLARPVLELARCAGDLLATAELAQVKACPGTGCGWLFLDRRGRRRWCSMEVCGNRAKARRHARRSREAAGQEG
jgi:predicted RNA-binding Zn ribbon-like protein